MRGRAAPRGLRAGLPGMGADPLTSAKPGIAGRKAGPPAEWISLAPWTHGPGSR
jgi:hypothetical protein